MRSDLLGPALQYGYLRCCFACLTRLRDLFFFYRDARPGFQYKIEDILSKQEMHGAPVSVETFESIGQEAVRAVVWAKDCGTVMFPPFYSFPDFSASAKRDIRNFVRSGTRLGP